MKPGRDAGPRASECGRGARPAPGGPGDGRSGVLARRAFVRRLPTLTGVVALGSWTLGACAGAAYLTPRSRGAALVVSARAVPAEGAFVARPGGEHPVFVVRRPMGWIALHARCTHRGCQPDVIGDRLVCPCHGSAFSYDGAVLEGPAREPLARIPVAQEGEDLVIRLDGGVA